MNPEVLVGDIAASASQGFSLRPGDGARLQFHRVRYLSERGGQTCELDEAGPPRPPSIQARDQHGKMSDYRGRGGHR